MSPRPSPALATPKLVHQSSEFTSNSGTEPQGAYATYGAQQGDEKRASVDRTTPPHAFRAILQSRAQLSFLILVVLQAIVVLALAIVVTVRYQASVIRETAILCYLILFVIAEVFAVLVTLDALRAKNLLEIWGIIAFQIAMLVYASILPKQLSDAIDDNGCRDFSCPPTGAPGLYASIRGPAIGIPAVLGAVLLGLAVNAWKLQSEFGWLVFKLIGADLRLVRAYTWLLAFETILKFDIFFLVGFCAQFIVLTTLGTSTAEFVITIVALPVVCVVILAIPYVCRREWDIGMAGVFFFELLGLAYAIFKTVRLFQPSQSYRFSSSRRSLALFSIITLVLLLITFAISIRVYLNFGIGLRQAIPQSTLRRLAPTRDSEEDKQKPDDVETATRVSID